MSFRERLTNEILMERLISLSSDRLEPYVSLEKDQGFWRSQGEAAPSGPLQIPSGAPSNASNSQASNIAQQLRQNEKSQTPRATKRSNHPPESSPQYDRKPVKR
uniref:Uncharacterized protein n=1 Tax=Caenorhabditis tropicalis TaxID=1561998 RepID=A0A1I7SXJ4_9PELO